jgi:outer membrane lipoprotein LolB
VTRRLAALSLVLLAGGCATLPAPAPVEDWPARRSALQALDAWALDGRIAVAAGEDGFSGGFDWEQAGDRAEVALALPLGGPDFAISLEGERVTLSSRGESITDDEARVAIADRLGKGNALPLTEIRYWLVGVPAPGLPHDETLSADMRLASLEQSGWRVRYDRYETVGEFELPARMEMTTEGLRLRVVVSRWQVRP